MRLSEYCVYPGATMMSREQGRSHVRKSAWTRTPSLASSWIGRSPTVLFYSTMKRPKASVLLLLWSAGCSESCPVVDDDTGDEPSTTAPYEMPSDLTLLDDDFEGSELAGWSVFQPNTAAVSVAGGQLHLVPAARSLWYNTSTAAHVHREVVHSRFMMTAPVTVRSEATPDAPPQPQYRLGGLMLRDPSAASPNYVFIVLGADANDVSVESKTTVDGVSTYDGPPWPSGAGELRICRWDAEFRMLVRSPGGPWSLQATYTRPDLPTRLAAGPLAYANNDSPDVRVRVDSIEFAELQSLDECAE